MPTSRLASIDEADGPTARHENRRPSPQLKRASAPTRIDLSSVTGAAPDSMTEDGA